MIIHLFILSSAVQMYEFSYIHCHNEISFAILCLLYFIFILFGTKLGGGGGLKPPQPLPLRGPCGTGYSLNRGKRMLQGKYSVILQLTYLRKARSLLQVRESAGTATSMIMHSLPFFFTRTISGLLA